MGRIPVMRHAPPRLSGRAVTPALRAALADLRRELAALDLGPLFYWVTVVQSPRTLSHRAMAWYHFDRQAIRIPRWTRRARRESARALGGKHLSLRAVLRHEFGHALSDFLGLDTRRLYKRAFGTGSFLTDYAMQNADEDFAETFMRFVTWGGELRRTDPDASLRAKWRLVRRAIREAGGLRPRLRVACPHCGEVRRCLPGLLTCRMCDVHFHVAS